MVFYERSNGQLCAALCTTGSDNLAAVLSGHSLQEAMNITAMTLLGLKSSLHFNILHSPFIGYYLSKYFPYLWGCPCNIKVYWKHTGFVNTCFLQKRPFKPFSWVLRPFFQKKACLAAGYGFTEADPLFFVSQFFCILFVLYFFGSGRTYSVFFSTSLFPYNKV